MVRGTWLTLLAVLAAAPAWADDDDHAVEIAVEALPDAVRSAVEAQWPGATLREAEKEGDEYEVEIDTTAGLHLEVTLKADGTVVMTEGEDEVEVEDDDDDDHDDDDDDHNDDDHDDD
ncbi:MAG: hypothetical protein JRJ84_15040 [Deltaproteobacteria bacterium]|nr:hypothetical protein [Deltaproteobacteria bacterium]